MSGITGLCSTNQTNLTDYRNAYTFVLIFFIIRQMYAKIKKNNFSGYEITS